MKHYHFSSISLSPYLPFPSLLSPSLPSPPLPVIPSSPTHPPERKNPPPKYTIYYLPSTPPQSKTHHSFIPRKLLRSSAEGRSNVLFQRLYFQAPRLSKSHHRIHRLTNYYGEKVGKLSLFLGGEGKWRGGGG